ncbi:MAG: hypothetical protein V1875_09635 [Candidatus Altiarchaeota archaeon]
MKLIRYSMACGTICFLVGNIFSLIVFLLWAAAFTHFAIILFYRNVRVEDVRLRLWKDIRVSVVSIFVVLACLYLLIPADCKWERIVPLGPPEMEDSLCGLAIGYTSPVEMIFGELTVPAAFFLVLYAAVYLLKRWFVSRRA